MGGSIPLSASYFQPALYLFIPPTGKVQNDLLLPRVLSRKYHSMASDYFLKRTADILYLRLSYVLAMILDPIYGQDKLSSQPVIASAMSATCEMWVVGLLVSSIEISDHNRVTVSIDLPIGTIDIAMSLADSVRKRYHVKRSDFRSS